MFSSVCIEYSSTIGKSSTFKYINTNKTNSFTGQQLVEEILDAQRSACPPEYVNIDIPHHLRKPGLPSQLPLLRTRYDMRTGYSPNNPRQQLNEITPYFDGGLVYGISKAWSDYLRLYENGTLAPRGLLATTEDGLFPARNTQRLPMANPPPPANHTKFKNLHELANVNRFFSKWVINITYSFCVK